MVFRELKILELTDFLLFTNNYFTETPLWNFVVIKVMHTSVKIRDFWTVTFEHTNLRISAYGSLHYRHFAS